MNRHFFIIAAVSLVSLVVRAVDPELISSASVATFHNKDGSINNDPFGGGSGMGWFFNGNLSDGAYIGPNGRAANGCYVLLDFSGAMPGGYYITDIAISEVSSYAYSLYYSANGSTWTSVPDATGVSKIGTATYGVNDIATQIKVVFDVIGGWNPSVSEIQVWGLDPADVECRHKAEFLTEWVPIQGTANCTERGIDQRECTNCGMVFTRESETLLALGHLFGTTLDRVGSGLFFGSGVISCDRHDFTIVCTNGPVDLVKYETEELGVQIGDIARDELVQFTDITVSSTGQTEYGVNPHHLIDGNWTMSWNNHWFAASRSVDEYVQFDFGVAIDLTSIDISVPNKTHTIKFCAVEDGVERIVAEHAILKDVSIPDEIWNAKENKNVSNPASSDSRWISSACRFRPFA